MMKKASLIVFILIYAFLSYTLLSVAVQRLFTVLLLPNGDDGSQQLAMASTPASEATVRSSAVLREERRGGGGTCNCQNNDRTNAQGAVPFQPSEAARRRRPRLSPAAPAHAPRPLPEAPYGDLCETRVLTRRDLLRGKDRKDSNSGDTYYNDGKNVNNNNNVNNVNVNNRNKKIIAYSFTHPPNTIPTWIWSGLVLNVKLARLYYPEWRVRVYTVDVNDTTIRKIVSLSDEVEVVRCYGTGPLGGPGTYLRVMPRFLAVDDPTVRYTMVRDLDSRFTVREVMAVNEWLASGAPFHVMHDSNAHRHVIMAGMFGMKRGVFAAADDDDHSSSNDDDDDYDDDYDTRGRGSNSGGNSSRNENNNNKTMTAILRDWLGSSKSAILERWFDQEFLEQRIWPVVVNRTMAHDMLLDRCRGRYGRQACRPFPVGPRDVRANHFVGAAFKTKWTKFNLDSNAAYSCVASCTVTREPLDFIAPFEEADHRRNDDDEESHSGSHGGSSSGGGSNGGGNGDDCSCTGDRQRGGATVQAEGTTTSSSSSFGDGAYICEMVPHRRVQQPWNVGHKNVISYAVMHTTRNDPSFASAYQNRHDDDHDDYDNSDDDDHDVWIGLDLNLKLAQRYFPEWVVRVYTLQVSQPVIDKILDLSPSKTQVEVVRCRRGSGNGNDDNNHDEASFARMMPLLAVDDPTVEHVMIRDLKTSRFSPKELMAVNEWMALSSDRSLHVMWDGQGAANNPMQQRRRRRRQEVVFPNLLDGSVVIDLKRDGLFDSRETTMTEIINRAVSQKTPSAKILSGGGEEVETVNSMEDQGEQDNDDDEESGDPLEVLSKIVWSQARQGTILQHDWDPQRCQRQKQPRRLLSDSKNRQKRAVVSSKPYIQEDMIARIEGRNASLESRLLADDSIITGPPPERSHSSSNEQTVLCLPFPLQGRVIASHPLRPSSSSRENGGERKLLVGGLPPSNAVARAESGGTTSTASEADASRTAATVEQWQREKLVSPQSPQSPTPQRRTSSSSTTTTSSSAAEYYYDCQVPCQMKAENLAIR